jgi:hypothetical protein
MNQRFPKLSCVFQGMVRLLRLLINQFVSKHPHTNVHGTTYETLTGTCFVPSGVARLVDLLSSYYFAAIAGKPLDHYCRDTILKMGAQPSNISTHGNLLCCRMQCAQSNRV